MTSQTKRREGMKPGQDLVIAGYIGLSGTRAVAGKREQELRQRFAEQFVKRCQRLNMDKLLPAPGYFIEAGAAEAEPSGEGGIMVTLWNLFEEYGLGFEIELRSIPVLQETIEVCEQFELNPYRLESEGCILLAADNGGDLVRGLNKEGIHGVVIGKVTAGIKRQMINQDVCSYLDRPKADELYRI